MLATVGTGVLVDAYAQQRTSMMQGRPRIVERLPTDGGEFIAVRVERPGEEASFESYYLQPRGNDWVIAHDTFFERALAGYVQASVQGTIDPSAEEPSARAVRASQRAAKAFRALFSPASGAPG